MRKTRRAGRPTAEETEQLNEAIVRAALELFTEHGVAETTFEMIAKACGTTRRSISHRFADKSALLIAAIELVSAEYRQRVFTPAAVLVGKPLEAVRHACRATFDYVCDGEFVAFYRLAIAESARSPVAGEVLIRLNDRFADELEVLVVRAQREGLFADQDPASTATALIGVFLSNPLNRRAFGDPQFRDDALRTQYFESLWTLVARHSA
ncbi:TetR/AcrR family transcriptional regulator [Phenylobacterium sp.]|uniref:TetR/AcrR family transcriptional regulator n=1 Tax=Phenylobacterium sp. TaxID=1871053 RepID=UPI0035B242D3